MTMRIVALIITLFVTPIYAKMYKCEVNGKTSYQQSPCYSGGSEIKAYAAPTEAQRRASAQRTNQYLHQKEEERRIAAEERRQRLEREEREYNTYINEQNALANIEQVEQNKQIIKEIKRIDTTPTVIVY